MHAVTAPRAGRVAIYPPVDCHREHPVGHGLDGVEDRRSEFSAHHPLRPKQCRSEHRVPEHFVLVPSAVSDIAAPRFVRQLHDPERKEDVAGCDTEKLLDFHDRNVGRLYGFVAHSKCVKQPGQRRPFASPEPLSWTHRLLAHDTFCLPLLHCWLLRLLHREQRTHGTAPQHARGLPGVLEPGERPKSHRRARGPHVPGLQVPAEGAQPCKRAPSARAATARVPHMPLNTVSLQLGCVKLDDACNRMCTRCARVSPQTRCIWLPPIALGGGYKGGSSREKSVPLLTTSLVLANLQCCCQVQICCSGAVTPRSHFIAPLCLCPWPLSSYCPSRLSPKSTGPFGFAASTVCLLLHSPAEQRSPVNKY